ncbi:MAG: hypothetical protein K1X44_02295 [Alphaproteobacteria bacterium]|nr:hypothetical protein [Alphaproteobacteria bacterium]
MNWLSDQIADYKIPIGLWVKFLLDWLVTNLSSILNGIEKFFIIILGGSMDLVAHIPPLMFILVIVVILYVLFKRWGICLVTSGCALLILNFGLWIPTMETLILVLLAIFMAGFLSFCLALLIGFIDPFCHFFFPFFEWAKTWPIFVYLIPPIIFFGVGLVAGFIAVLIYIMPGFILSLAKSIQTHAHKKRKEGENLFHFYGLVILMVITKTLPLIVHQSLPRALSMVLIASLIGLGGLGALTIHAINMADIDQVFEAGFAILLLSALLYYISHKKFSGLVSK